MATNHYFNHFRNTSEQKLQEDLTIESIKIYGQDVYYIPRELVNKDKLFGEDNLSKFHQYFQVEMYLESVDGFEGDGDFISKFGLQIKDSARLVVSKSRFKRETNKERPLEGDLIYFPLTGGLFEVKFVEHEHIFYQLGKNHTFQLSVELFQYNQEDVAMGVDEIDSIISSRDYRKFITFGSPAGISGSFAVGDSVYTYKNGSITGSFAGANGTATVLKTSNDAPQLTLGNIVGNWAASITGTSRYITNATNTASYPISSITDTIDADSYDDNSNIQTEADDVLNFSETNPFADDGAF